MHAATPFPLVRASLVGRALPALAALLAAAACGDDSAGTPPDGGPPDALADAGPPDAGPPDVGPPDAGPPDAGDAGPPGCAERLAPGLELELDPDGADGQIHASLAFDGEALWAVWSVPEGGTGSFDIALRRFGCDGAPLGAVVPVMSAPGGNDIDPEIAVAPGGGALVVWTADDGSGGTANLQAFYRRFAADGAPGEPERRLATTRDGMAVPDNHLDARVTAIADGFLVAGARALPDVMRFQAYLQALDGSGALLGDARDLLHESGVSQTRTAVAARAADDGWYAFEREPDDATDARVFLGRLGDAADPVAASLDLPATGAPSLALDATTPGRAWLAYQGEVLNGEVDVWVVDASAPEAERSFVRFGERRRLDHTPVLAPDDVGGGAVAWYRNASGIRNELWAARFAPDPATGELGAGAPVQVALDVPPYAPAIVHLAGDVYALAWSTGTSPAFRLRAGLVALPAP